MNQQMNSGIVSDAKSTNKTKYYVVCVISQSTKFPRFDGKGDVIFARPLCFNVFHCWRTKRWYSCRTPDGKAFSATSEKKHAAIYATREEAELALQALGRQFVGPPLSWIGRIFELDEESARGRSRFGSDDERSNCSCISCWLGTLKPIKERLNIPC